MLAHNIRTAFTLVEVLVAIALLGILGAVIVPTTVDAKQDERVRATARDLLAIKAANDDYSLGGAKAQLGRISFATVPPEVGDSTSCNGLEPGGGVDTYTASQVGASWNGPYMNRVNSKDGGFVTGIGIMNDVLVRTTPSGTTGDLVVTIPAVRFEDANALNKFMDGDANNPDLSNTLNDVRYGVPDGSMQVDLTYEFAMQSKTC
jgi:prepilin-type N-terminal cleavage/methylation domain-containing protein